jgi:hypothetical protein
MTNDELELVARVIYRLKSGFNMPNRRPTDVDEEESLEGHRRAALIELQKHAELAGLTVTRQK